MHYLLQELLSGLRPPLFFERVPAPAGGALSFRRKCPKPFPRSAGCRRRQLPCALRSLRSLAERRSLASRPEHRRPWRCPFGLTWLAAVLGSRYGYKNQDIDFKRLLLFRSPWIPPSLAARRGKGPPIGRGEVRMTNRRSGPRMARLRRPEPGEKRGHAAESEWSPIRFQPSAESPGRVSLVTFFA